MRLALIRPVLFLSLLLAFPCITAGQDTATLANQGKDAYLKGKFGKAIELLEKSYAEGDRSRQTRIYLTNAYILKAQTCIKQEKFEEAIALFDKGVKLSPERTEVQTFYEKAKRGERAQVLVRSGAKAYRSKKLVDAVREWRNALNLYPGFSPAQKALAGSRGECIALARRYYKQALDSYSSAEYENAVETWHKVLLLYPEHPTAKKDIEKALKVIKGFKERGM
jgi:tetratricopeptide (TPR) repeat protein